MQLIELAELWPTSLYKVGGCVRDDLLNIPTKDIDICSSLLPEQVIAICDSNNIPYEVINESHLVVLVNKKWEHTTFRKESNCDGTHADVTPSLSLEEDAFRRDLTINAIYQNILTGELIDPVGGVKDIKDKTLRLISSDRYGACIDRLHEHGGRLFRLARFTIKFEDWAVEKSTWEACREFSPKVFDYGNVEAFVTEWEKCNYNWKYLSFLNDAGFLTSHNLNLPSEYKDIPKAWFYLWEGCNFPDINQFQNKWKFSNESKDICIDIFKGMNLVEDWEWVTTKFKRLSAEEVAKHYNKSFIRLNIPTQGEIAKEIGPGPNVIPEWIKRVKEAYEFN